MRAEAAKNLYITLSFTPNLGRLSTLNKITSIGKREGLSRGMEPLVDPSKEAFRQFLYHSAFMDHLLQSREKLKATAASGQPFYVSGTANVLNPNLHIDFDFRSPADAGLFPLT